MVAALDNGVGSQGRRQTSRGNDISEIARLKIIEIIHEALARAWRQTAAGSGARTAPLPDELRVVRVCPVRIVRQEIRHAAQPDGLDLIVVHSAANRRRAPLVLLREA